MVPGDWLLAAGTLDKRSSILDTCYSMLDDILTGPLRQNIEYQVASGQTLGDKRPVTTIQ
jgi:hypothetical protein